jgi:hypothetical protein
MPKTLGFIPSTAKNNKKKQPFPPKKPKILKLDVVAPST